MRSSTMVARIHDLRIIYYTNGMVLMTNEGKKINEKILIQIVAIEYNGE
jgi:hypothetical protein